MQLGTFFKKFTASLTAASIFLTSVVVPTQAHAQGHLSDAAIRANSGFTSLLKNDLTSRRECARTPGCEWDERVPLDQWEEVASLHNPQGNTPVDGSQYFKGERWMAVGEEAAGILGLSSSQIVLDSMQKQIAQPPWIIARYLAEKAELRIHAVKVIKTPDGYQRVMVSDYTPDFGRWHVVWRHFLRPEEHRNPYVRGIDPYTQFRSGTAVFKNVTPGAAQAIMGQAMMYYSAPFGLFIEPTLRINQWQTTGGNKLRRKITTHTEGFARPRIFLAAPIAMTPGFNTTDPGAMGMYCPRTSGCTDPDEIVFSGFVLQEATGGNIPNIEDRLFYDQETKSSWTVVAFALVTAALIWTGGAALAGSASWGFSAGSGFVATAGGGAAAATAGTTITAAAGLGYGALNLIAQPGSLTSPQRGWFESTGWDPRSIPSGTMSGATANNKYAQKLYNTASQRHIQSGNPGTAASGGNLRGTNMMVQGNCPLDWGIKQCEAAGLDPGQAPRKDMHTNRAMNTTDYTRKVNACTKAGYGYNQEILNYCLATAVFFEAPKKD